MTELLQDATFWFAVSFVIFVAIAIPLARKPVGAVFEGYAQKIRAELEEAARLRQEAEELLFQAKKRQHDARQEAEDMLKMAAEQADQLRTQAAKDLDAALKRREAQANDHLRMLEEQAANEIRNAAAARALKAAEIFLQNNFSASEDQALIQKQIRQVAKV